MVETIHLATVAGLISRSNPSMIETKRRFLTWRGSWSDPRKISVRNVTRDRQRQGGDHDPATGGVSRLGPCQEFWDEC
jgi:hypothetical protein